MIFVYLLIFFMYGSCAHAMKKAPEHTPDKHTLQPRDSLKKVLLTSGPGFNKHIKRAGDFANKALAHNPNGLMGELTSIKALTHSVEAFQENKHDDALLCCIDVINGPLNTPLLKQARSEAFSLVQQLADQKEHTLSRFYLMKHLLNSSNPNNVQDGLRRFDALFAQNIVEKDYKNMALLFEHSEIIDDIIRLADSTSDCHAQYIMAEYHLFLAQRGAELDGSPTEPRGALKKALIYAQKSVEGHYPESKILLDQIQAACNNIEVRASSPIAELLQEVLPGLSQESILIEEQVAPKVSVSCQQVPLKLLSTLELFKKINKNDSRQLYAFGKKLVYEESDQLHAVGRGFLKESAQLGHPCAAELMGDMLYGCDPERAIAYYFKALHRYTHASRGSYWHTIGCFKRRVLESKLESLGLHEQGIGQYRVAGECGNAGAMEKELYGVCNKNHVEAVAGIVHTLETRFAHSQATTDTLILESLATSGVLFYMERLKEHQEIKNVLIQALAMRGHVGRGFILKEKTSLAHYKKALHFILDPEGASKQSFDEPVADQVLLTKIKIDTLPMQHRIIYLEAMLGVIEHLSVNKNINKKQAQYICHLFTLCACALNDTKDNHLKQLHQPRYASLLVTMPPLALVAQAQEYLEMIGNCCFGISAADALGQLHLEAADMLLTKALCMQGNIKKNPRAQEIKGTLSRIKLLRAEIALEQGNSQEGLALCRAAMQYNPDNVQSMWKCSQLLMEGGHIELRKEGFGLIQKLADKYRHRPALDYVVDAYCHHRVHFVERDLQKAIPYLQQLIVGDAPGHSINRIRLAHIYIAQATKVSGIYQKKLLAKAHDLIRHYRHHSDEVHLMYLDILHGTGRIQELLQELQAYVPQGMCSDTQIYDLAQSYFVRGSGSKNSVSQALVKKAEQLVQPIKHNSDNAYLLLLTVLLKQDKHDQLAQELAIEKKTNLRCFQECFAARSLLVQHKSAKLDHVIEHFENAFNAFDAQFVQNAALDTQELVNMIHSIGVCQYARLTHPAKSDSLEQLEKVSECIGQMLNNGDVPVNERMRVHAYNGYFNVKINLLRVAQHKATYDDVMRVIGKAVEAANNANDKICKFKLYQVLITQIRWWIETHTFESLATRIRTGTMLLCMCNKLCKGLDEYILSVKFYDIVQGSEVILDELDISACSEDDKKIIELQKQIISRIKSDLSKARK